METNIDPHNELPVGVKKNLPRDVFLHLFSVVALYWSAVSFITLCWQYANYFFPDALYYNYGYTGAMRFALASLLIVYPLFILVSWFLNKIYTAEGQVRESKIRKWLIYITLFVTALVIVGDLVFVLNTFFSGEVTARFIVKALSVIVVAGVIFGYYLDDVRRDMPSKSAKVFAVICSFVVAILFVGAFLIVGSPATARKVEFDNRRVSDLQNIQSQVVYYWQQKGILPIGLSDLNDSISGYVAPVDPETGAAYEYSAKDFVNLKFELCANFSLENVAVSPNGIPAKPRYENGISEAWTHGSGRSCFERTIDPEFYKPFPNV